MLLISIQGLFLDRAAKAASIIALAALRNARTSWRRVLLSGVISCGAILANMAVAQSKPIFDPDYRALVPAPQAMQLVSSNGGCSTMQETLSGLTVTSTWEVSPEQADSIEPALAFRLGRAVDAANWMPLQMRILYKDYQIISNHALQFIGVIIDGKKDILIIGAEAQMYDFGSIYQNFSPKGKWREVGSAIGICDGGPANFSVLYDVDAKKFGEFALSKIGGVGTYIPTTKFPPP